MKRLFGITALKVSSFFRFLTKLTFDVFTNQLQLKNTC